MCSLVLTNVYNTVYTLLRDLTRPKIPLCYLFIPLPPPNPWQSLDLTICSLPLAEGHMVEIIQYVAFLIGFLDLAICN